VARADVHVEPLAERLNPLINREISSIGTIQTAIDQQEEPDYVFLYQETKTSKQANVEQMATLIRAAGGRPAESGTPVEPLLKLQTMLTQKVSTTATLKAMRLVEETLVADYRHLHAELERERRGSLEHRAMKKIMERAVKHWHVLTAHIAKRQDGDSDEASRLPYPLSRYFAHGEAKACMRCFLDRPGELPVLEKRDPHPYTYICRACHDEVLAGFPPDLLEQVEVWPEEVRDNRVIHLALGKPEKLRAINEVHAVLSGLEPEVPVRAAERPAKQPAALKAGRTRREQPPAVEIRREGAEPDELAYTDLLFDYRSVRANW
jgi:hypothetical protein